MAINEVFPNPTVKRVIFQVRFPNLFYMESRMGDFQLKVMQDFPTSSLTINRQMLIAQGTSFDELGKSNPDALPPEVEKIWNFASPTGVELHVKSDSMDLSSTVHKTYNNPASDIRFRDSIKKAVDALLGVVAIPMFSRVGLRYIDDCPVPALENVTYRDYYNTTLALDRFGLPDVGEITHSAVVRRGGHSVRVREDLRFKDGKPCLTLDFDAFSASVPSATCMDVTDALHDLVIAEYEKTLREPVLHIMRQPRP